VSRECSAASAARRNRPAAVSLVELLVVIGVVSVLAGVGIPVILNSMPSVSYDLAERNLNYLNGAVLSFNQSNWELVLTTSAGTDDELAIFNSLRYRDQPGSPYLPDTAVYAATSSTNDYRAVWNGRMFEMVIPGNPGDGINLLGLTSNITNQTALPSDFRPVGSP